MFVAGENSGDQHAARVIERLRELVPGIECFGFGGDRMEAAGMRLEENLAQKLPVIGFTQVIRNYRKLKSLLARGERMLLEEKPDALVLVDYPGFNLRLAKAAFAAGVPVIYYISPQIWAWHRERLETIARCVTRMLVILPFEEQIYRDAGVPVTYVGHPLHDDATPVRPRDEVRAELGVGPGEELLGLIPGSREPEILRHMPILLDAARLIRASRPAVRFVLPRASTVSPELVRKYLDRAPDLGVIVAEHDLKSVRAAMDFAVCKSGTSTLELALLGVPMVIIYRVSAPTYLLAKALVKIPWVGLVNIVANDVVAPELIQGDANPQRIASEVLRLLGDPAALAAMRDGMSRVRAKVGKGGASLRAAEEIASVLKEKAATGN
jgi:lipid-A-disaccharide synthase